MTNRASPRCFPHIMHWLQVALGCNTAPCGADRKRCRLRALQRGIEFVNGLNWAVDVLQQACSLLQPSLQNPTPTSPAYQNEIVALSELCALGRLAFGTWA